VLLRTRIDLAGSLREVKTLALCGVEVGEEEEGEKEGFHADGGLQGEEWGQENDRKERWNIASEGTENQRFYCPPFFCLILVHL
jgi:hypothetical protein